MTLVRRVITAAVALVLVAATGGAQVGGSRGRLEEQVRERLGRVVREQLALDDEQMRRLQQVNQRYETQRRELVRQERDARIDLRREVMRGDSADQKRTDTLLNTLLQIQRRRLDLVQSEQRDLAAFLTPVQRAKYLALQDQMRRRVEEARQRGLQRRGGGAGQGRPRP